VDQLRLCSRRHCSVPRSHVAILQV
jgi:hypothetical protein